MLGLTDMMFQNIEKYVKRVIFYFFKSEMQVFESTKSSTNLCTEVGTI